MVSAMAHAASRVPRGRRSDAPHAHAGELGVGVSVPPVSKTDVESESGVKMRVSDGAIESVMTKRIAAQLVAVHVACAKRSHGSWPRAAGGGGGGASGFGVGCQRKVLLANSVP